MLSRPHSGLVLGLVLSFVFGLLATVASPASPASAADLTPGYDAIPTVLPGNVGSTGYEAGRVSELGDHITLAGTERDAADLPVTVVMSVWACGNGGFRETCSTTPGQTFDQPITLNLYEVDSSGPNPALGDLILTKTQTFTLAFRPSPDPVNCPSSDFYPWYSAADGLCFSGLAQEITFDLSAFDDVLPDSLIWGIAFNGQISGYDPVGTQGPWNFLNLGTRSLMGQPSHGTDVEQDAVFMNSHYDWWYADGGAGGIDTFRRDTGWNNSRPLARFGVYAAELLDTELVVDPATGPEGGTVSLTATLTSMGVGVPNATIHFSLGGTAQGDATTNASGVATLAGVDISSYADGTYPGEIGGEFDGNDELNGSNDVAALTVTAASEIAPTGDIGGPCSDPAYYGIFDNTASNVALVFRYRWNNGIQRTIKKTVPAGAIFRTWEKWAKPSTAVRVAYKNPTTGNWVTLASRCRSRATIHGACTSADSSTRTLSNRTLRNSRGVANATPRLRVQWWPTGWK